jgi:hypothetical protein
MPTPGGRSIPPVSPFHQLRQAQEALAAAEAELIGLQDELQRFEKELDARLGPLLDQLSALDAEVQALTSQIIDLRETRVFGDLRASYTGPYFAHLPDPTVINETKQSPHLPGDGITRETIASPPDPQADLKALYRRLARRYHPDLARSELERVHNTEQMTAINQAYTSGNLRALRLLAGEYVRAETPDYLAPARRLSALEQVQARLRQVQAQIHQLQMLPIVQLSLEAKLVRRQGRSLLSEMVVDLHRKLARKTAERDYLRSQLEHAK